MMQKCDELEDLRAKVKLYIMQVCNCLHVQIILFNHYLIFKPIFLKKKLI